MYNQIKMKKNAQSALHGIINSTLASTLSEALCNLFVEYPEYPVTFFQAEKYLQNFPN